MTAVAVTQEPTDDHDSDDREPPTAENRQLWAWSVDHLTTRFDALTAVNTRRATGVDATEARDLFDDMAQVIADHGKALQTKVDAYERLLHEHRRMMIEYRAMKERLDAAEGQAPAGSATMAVSAVVDGQRTAEQLIAEAEADAARVREEARQVLAGAQAVAHAAGQDLERPQPTGKIAADFLAHVQYLAEEYRRRVAERDAAQAKLDDANARLAEIEAEKAEAANVLPMAVRELPAAVLDVREVDEIEQAS